MRPSLAVSLTLHAGAFLALMNAPSIQLPEPGKSEYKQVIAGNEPKLIWYNFKNKELPQISSRAAARPAKAATIARQEIVASPKQAPRQIQIVWTPAPELPAPAPVALPNLLAVKLPPVRQFVTPPDIQKPRPVPVEPLPDAPAIPLQPVSTVDIPAPAKFVKRFVAPPKRVPPKLAEVATPTEAPQMALNIPQADLDYKMKTPTRPFTAPPSKPVAAAPQPDLPDAPTDLNIAVVGLNPADKFVPLPIAPSPAQFSAAPQIRKEGADAVGDARGLALPDVSVRGARDLKTTLLAQAYAAPTSAMTMREAMRLTNPVRSPDPIPHSGAARVSGAPDARFNDRDVYMMAIQMPNLTSYSGSWLMWYADRSLRQTGLPEVAPPVPHRKVDPKYVASAIADHVEGKIQLFCIIGKDGTVSGIELVRGLDDRLNATAAEALSKWEFYPATREGEPVTVEALVEIPFKLR